MVLGGSANRMISITRARDTDATLTREMKSPAFLNAATVYFEGSSRTSSKWPSCVRWQSCTGITGPTRSRRRTCLMCSTLWNQPERFKVRGKKIERPLAFTRRSLMGIRRGRDTYSRISNNMNSIAGEDAASGNAASRKLGVAVALFSTYFSVMFAKCALPSTLSLLTAPDSGLTRVFPTLRLVSTLEREACKLQWPVSLPFRPFSYPLGSLCWVLS